MIRCTLLTNLSLVFNFCFSSALQAADTYDVVVYGGTSAGVVAAVQTARMGKSVAVVSPDKHLGGLTSGGLGWTDSGNKAVIGGVSREFYQRVKKYYDRPQAWKFQKPAQYSRYRPSEDAMWTFAPSVAEQIYDQLIAEEKIPLHRNEWLDRKAGVKVQDGRIASITTLSGKTFSGRMFIDATYEGDLMAAAGVSYTVGREANDKYGESLNGVQKAQNNKSHRFVKAVDPYVKPGDPKSGLVFGVHGDPPGKDGQGDHRVQAYCFRMCMSNVPQNRVPFPKPDGYDESRYELLLRNFEAGDLRLPLKIDMMPNGKTDTNNNCAFSTDYIGANYDYPDASYKERERILADHENYQQGLMWTLANHRRVPESIRNRMAQWGLAKDEFLDNGHWPHQMYIREARRMVSDYVTTEHDCRRSRVAADSVGLGSYNMDSHNCQRYIGSDGHVQNEGDVQVSPRGAYLISYRSIVPKKGEAENLLVPVCLSSSHIAFGSIRMEPVFMILGQSAATAAVQAIGDGVNVQEVDYQKLRKRLLDDKQVLDLPSGTAPATAIDPKKLDGIVLDDSQARLTGDWLPSSSVGPFVGSGYLHDNDEGKGSRAAHFETKLNAGRYEVRLAYSANPNRAGNVPVLIEYGDTKKSSTIDQRKVAPIDKLLIKVGQIELTAETVVRVAIGNKDTNGHVIVDAVQFLPQ